MELARLLEAAKFHGIFIADVLGETQKVDSGEIAADRVGGQADMMCSKDRWSQPLCRAHSCRSTIHWLLLRPCRPPREA